jgi:hypothetical protein
MGTRVDGVGAIFRGHGAEGAHDRSYRKLDVLVEDGLTVPDFPDLGVRRLRMVAQHTHVRDQRDVPLIVDRDIDYFDNQGVPRTRILDVDGSGERIQLRQ